jgi:hypothetical protein
MLVPGIVVDLRMAASTTVTAEGTGLILAGVIWMLGWCIVLLAALFIYLGGEVRFREGGPTITVLYTIVSWIGVMALGYAYARSL